MKLAVTTTSLKWVAMVHLLGSAMSLPGACDPFDFVEQGPFAAGSVPVAVAAGDFNEDGRADLVVANRFSANLSVLLASADETFLPATSYGVGPSPSAVTVGFLDDDSHLDLAVADAVSTDAWVLLGNGDGSFQAPLSSMVGEVSRSIAAADLDGDAIPDLVLANREIGEISILLGDGTGHFTFETSLSAGVDPTHVAVADLDGDEALDLVVANAALFDVPPSVSVIISRGGGAFRNAVNYTAGVSPRSVAIGDFNGDDVPDLAVANFGGVVGGTFTNSSISVLLGEGGGSFHPPLHYEAGEGPIFLALSDLDFNGNVDLVVVNNRSRDVSFLLGQGDGTFDPSINQAAGFGPQQLAIGDYNDDRADDLGIVNSSGVLVLLAPVDHEPPVLLSLPEPFAQFQCPAEVPPPPLVTAMDVCDESVEVFLTEEATGDACMQVIERTWSAVDAAGNLATFMQTITIEDTQGPVLVKGQIAPGYQSVAEAEAAAVAATQFNDNCIVTPYASTVGSCEVAITVTGRDACGNEQSVIYNTQINNVPPLLLGLPAPEVGVQCLVHIPPPPTVTAMDDCQGAVPVQYSENLVGMDCQQSLLRTWTAADLAGNAASFTQVFTVRDDMNPIMTMGEIAGAYETAAEAEAAALAATVANDNCSAVTLRARTTGDCVTATITVTGRDACGNLQAVAYAAQVNRVPPWFEGVPGESLRLQCPEEVPEPPMVIALDDCEGMVPVQFEETSDGDACAMVITRTWSATDSDGNASTFTQTITIRDDTSPVLQAGGIASAYKTPSEAGMAAVAATMAADNCSTVSLSASTAGGCEAIITVTGQDACGNQSHVDYHARIDGDPPVLSGLPKTPVLRVQCLAEVPSPEPVTALDNCDGERQVTFTETMEGDSCVLVITRRWSAIDTTGNAASFVQTITVQDDTPPALVKGSVATGYPTVEAAEAIAIAATGASDNCSAVVLTAETEGDCDAVVTVTGMDDCGNLSTLTYQLQINAVAPVLANLPPPRLDFQCFAEVPAPSMVTAMDDCQGEIQVVLRETSSGDDCSRVITRTWTATDASNNSVSYTQTVNIEDRTPPIVMAGTIAAGYQTIAAAESAAADATVVMDNCAAEVSVQAVAGCEIMVTVTATDVCGAQDSVSYLTQVNQVPPVLNGLPSSTLRVHCLAEVPEPPNVTATDDCDGTREVSYAQAATGDACNQVITRTWSATDVSGNDVSYTQTITVLDDTPPMLSAGTLATGYVSASDAEAAAIAATQAQDNCSAVALKAITAGTCAAVVTVTGTDACGNAQSITYNVQINSHPPQLSDLPAVSLTLQCPAQIPVAAVVTASDDCDGPVPIEFVESQMEDACRQTILRTWTATDTVGNTAAFTQVIMIEDTIPPVVLAGSIAPEYVTREAAEAAAMAATEFSDNCAVLSRTVAVTGACDATITVTATDLCGNQTSALYQACILSEIKLRLMVIGDRVFVRWPYPSPGFELEYAADLVDPEWKSLPGRPSVEGEYWEDSVSISRDNARFFRLVRP